MRSAKLFIRILALSLIATLSSGLVAGMNSLSALRRGGAYVLEQEGNVIGVAVLEYTFFEHGFISWLYVKPDARRTGTGEMLLRYLVSICQTPKLFSSTNQSNRPMQALFAKAGFEQSGMIHNLDPDDPEIVYYKAVKAGASAAIDAKKQA